MVHVLKSDASLLVDQSGAKFDTTHVTGHEMRWVGQTHVLHSGSRHWILIKVSRRSKRTLTNIRTSLSVLIDEANIQISALKAEHENVKKPSAIVNVRTSTMRAVLCVPFILQTRTSCGGLWDASHVVIPLLNDTGMPPGAKVCKECLSHFNLAVFAAEGSSIPM